MSREDRLRVVETRMPQSAEELSRLLAEEWTRRAKEAAHQAMEEAASVAAAASSLQAEDAGLETRTRRGNPGKVEIGISRGAMARIKERFGVLGAYQVTPDGTLRWNEALAKRLQRRRDRLAECLPKSDGPQ